MVKVGDVIYCDPPYDGTFTDYHTDGFNELEQRRLVTTLDVLASAGHQVVVSNSETELTNEIYQSFTRHRINAKRSMGVAGGDGKSATEIIAVSQPLIWSGFDLAAYPVVSASYETFQREYLCEPSRR